LRANRLREIWKKGEAVVNGWLSIPSAFSAEVMSHQGFDSLTIDMQHGVVDYQVAVTMLQGIAAKDVVPLARVPEGSHVLIKRVLDAGAQAELDTLSPLRQLRRHDTEHNTAFVTTLRTWLRAHGNYRQAAGALHIHANTLRYRMQRLTELTSLDLADPDVRLVLELQLHLEGV